MLRQRWIAQMLAMEHLAGVIQAVIRITQSKLEQLKKASIEIREDRMRNQDCIFSRTSSRPLPWLPIKHVAVLVVIFEAFGFLGIAAPSDDPWKRIENNSFSFSVPSSFKKTEQTGIDSFVEEFLADGIEISFDLGIYSNDFGDWPKETKFESVKVNGRAARIGSVGHEFHKGFSYSTQIYIKLDGGVALSMFAACKSEKEVAIARKIFETIMFNPKKP